MRLNHPQSGVRAGRVVWEQDRPAWYSITNAIVVSWENIISDNTAYIVLSLA